MIRPNHRTTKPGRFLPKLLTLLAAAGALFAAPTSNAQVINFDAPGGAAGFTNYSGQGAFSDPGNNTWNAVVANGTTSASLYSNGTSSPITFTFSCNQIYTGGGQGTNGTPAGLESPFGVNTSGVRTCSLNNVPAGTYTLYLYGINGGFWNRGTTFTVGTTSASTVNSSAASNSFIEWNNYVVIPDIVVPTGGGAISFTYQANANVEVGGSPNAEGDFNGLQLVKTAAQVDTIVPYLSVWTAHMDNGRTGANLNEASLTSANVNQTSFGLAFTDSTDGDMYGQPLYVRGITLGGNIVNAVYVSSANNSVYCFDADSAGVSYWAHNLGPAIPQGNVQCCCTDVETVIGIISTGVIDLTTQTWYVVTQEFNSTSGAYAQHLHALDLYSGDEKFGGPVAISGTSGTQTWNAKMNNQRAALLLQNGVLYIGFSSHNDCTPYNGWVLGYNATTLAQTCAYVDTPNGSQGGIWQAGGGLVGDGVNTYFLTGNGTFDLNTGGSDASMSLVRMTSAGTRADSFTPTAESSLNGADRDVGGGALCWIPGTRVVAGGGKPGVLYVADMDNMGGFNSSADACLQSFMVTSTTQGLNHLHGPPTFFNGILYMGGESDFFKGYAWNGSSFPTTPTTQSSFTDVLNSMPGFQSSASGNGAQNGIIWATRVQSGNANNATQPGLMHAFTAGSLGTELYDTLQNSTRDNFGNFAKDPAPLCANGKVYCPTFSNKLAVYGPLTTYRSGCSGLMSSWRLSDGTGTSAADSTGNGNTGTLTGTASWGAGPTGNFSAFNFNGASYFSCGDAQTLNTTNAISVTGWFKTSQTTGASILRHDGHFTALQTIGGGMAQTALWNNGVLNEVQFSWTYSDGNWHHYASTYDMTQGCNIYVDGTLIASNTALLGPLSTATVSGGSVTSPTPFQLGAKEGGSEFYTGSLALVEVWDRALSHNEISGLASKGTSGNTGGAYVEAEQAQIVSHTAGVPITIVDSTILSNNSASVLQATAVNQQVAYLVQNLTAKSYTVKIGVEKQSNAGQVQVGIGPAGGSLTNQGTVQDLYSATPTAATLTINTAWAPGSSSDKWVWFTVTGKNASSSGFVLPIDFISITPN